jgi:hypothetical protein
MIETSPTALEMAVLRAIGKQLPVEDQLALEEQIDGIVVSSRENTGVGFYTNFSLQSKLMKRINADTTKCHISANIEGIDNGLGFILWLNDGYVDCLEGYTYTDSTVNKNLAALNFEVFTESPSGHIP